MFENRCPTCSAQQTLHHPTQGLERRRFPRGKWVCEHESQAWHLSLENAKRELATCSSEAVKLALLFEITLLEQQISTQHQSQPRTYAPTLTKCVPNSGEHTVRPSIDGVEANCMFALPHNVFHKFNGNHSGSPKQCIHPLELQQKFTPPTRESNPFCPRSV
jgi:hypothetical protein